MANTRIKALTPTDYNGNFVIAVDSEISGTRSIALSNLPNTRYKFEGGENSLSVTASDGSISCITITPKIQDNITGSGAKGYLAKFSDTSSITSLVEVGQSGASDLKFLNERGQFTEPKGVILRNWDN